MRYPHHISNDTDERSKVSAAHVLKQSGTQDFVSFYLLKADDNVYHVPNSLIFTHKFVTVSDNRQLEFR